MSSVLKIFAGRASDRTGRRKPFVVVGYTHRVVWCGRSSRWPTAWPHVFAVRLSDRVGKGLRGAPRDAMLGALAPARAARTRLRLSPRHGPRRRRRRPARRCRVLVVLPGRLPHALRAHDHSGSTRGGDVVLVPDVVARAVPAAHPAHRRSVGAPAHPAHRAPALQATRFLFILALFTLGNSTDAFLLLRLSDAGLADRVPAARLGRRLHVVKAGLSTTGGALSDRLGRGR